MEKIKEWGEGWAKANLTAFIKGLAAERGAGVVFSFFQIVKSGNTSNYAKDANTKVLRLWFGDTPESIDYSATYVPVSHKVAEGSGETIEELKKFGDLLVLESEEDSDEESYIFVAKDKNIDEARSAKASLKSSL